MTWLDDFVGHAAGNLTERAREALWARGVTDEQTSLFQIGYLDRELPEGIDFPPGFLDWSFRGGKLDDVFVLPLTNTLGEIHGLQFRHVDRERTGYMDFIEKGDLVLFGLGQAIPHIWETRSILLVEGGFDLFPVQRFYAPTVATLTARVVDPLVRILRRLVDRIWLGYDMDDTGRKASARFVRQHGEEFGHVGIVDYPRVCMVDGKLSKDPSDLWEAWGDQKFSAFLASVIHSDPKTEPFHA